MPRIYLIYRRTDAHPDVERVIGGLIRAHGAASLVRGVPFASGDAFRTGVESAIRDCVGAVVIVGPEFNPGPDALGRRRLDNPEDPFRIEIETALKLKSMMVLVAMVGGLFMPDPQELPRSLRPLTRRGAIPMGAVESFDDDQSHLNTAVRKMLDGSAKRAVRIVSILFIVIMLASIAFAVVMSIASGSNVVAVPQ